MLMLANSHIPAYNIFDVYIGCILIVVNALPRGFYHGGWITNNNSNWIELLSTIQPSLWNIDAIIKIHLYIYFSLKIFKCIRMSESLEYLSRLDIWIVIKKIKLSINSFISFLLSSMYLYPIIGWLEEKNSFADYHATRAPYYELEFWSKNQIMTNRSYCNLLQNHQKPASWKRAQQSHVISFTFHLFFVQSIHWFLANSLNKWIISNSWNVTFLFFFK